MKLILGYLKLNAGATAKMNVLRLCFCSFSSLFLLSFITFCPGTGLNQRTLYILEEARSFKRWGGAISYISKYGVVPMKQVYFSAQRLHVYDKVCFQAS